MSQLHKVGWVVPSIGVWSGGLRTVFRHVRFMAEQGIDVSLHVNACPENWMPADRIKRMLSDSYGLTGICVYDEPALDETYDLAIATYYDTVRTVAESPCRSKVHFAQDFERWFFPMSYDALAAEQAFGRSLPAITIGRWLAAKLHQEYGTNARAYDFCADLETYKPLGRHKLPFSKRAICAIWQPDKPRRAAMLLEESLGAIAMAYPKLQIYLYGSDVPFGKPLPNIINLGLLTPEECNELYNKCQLGICFSLSNPSRIPFEMMAAGLPVVELYRENNLYDLPEGAVRLAEPRPAAVAAAAGQLLEDPSMRKVAHDAALDFMRDRPINKELTSFLAIAQDFCEEGAAEAPSPMVSYQTKVIVETERMRGACAKFESWAEERYDGRRRPVYSDEINVTLTGLETGLSYLLAVWCAPDQSDIKWYVAERQGKDFVVHVSLANHSFHNGLYLLHLYGRDEKAGTQQFIQAFSKFFYSPSHPESEVDAGQSLRMADAAGKCEISFEPLGGA